MLSSFFVSNQQSTCCWPPAAARFKRRRLTNPRYTSSPVTDITVADYHQLLVLLCRDFPRSIVEAATARLARRGHGAAGLRHLGVIEVIELGKQWRRFYLRLLTTRVAGDWAPGTDRPLT